ncbi:excalibur calcium-binding domain-containing protein, partial [Segeticoccus rhizosphaerae]
DRSAAPARPLHRTPRPERTRHPAPPAPLVSIPKNPVAPVYYTNCDAARAAGAAPVHRGDPGYARHLDRDGDGVGCE